MNETSSRPLENNVKKFTSKLWFSSFAKDDILRTNFIYEDNKSILQNLIIQDNLKDKLN
jgi:hypothetical protein